MQNDLSNYLSGGSLVTSLASAYYFQQKIAELEERLEKAETEKEQLKVEMLKAQKTANGAMGTAGKNKKDLQRLQERTDNVCEFLENDIGDFEDEGGDDEDDDEDSESEEESESDEESESEEEEERKPKGKNKAKSRPKTKAKAKSKPKPRKKGKSRS